jgi:hypothetical protein
VVTYHGRDSMWLIGWYVGRIIGAVERRIRGRRE